MTYGNAEKTSAMSQDGYFCYIHFNTPPGVEIYVTQTLADVITLFTCSSHSVAYKSKHKYCHQNAQTLREIKIRQQTSDSPKQD